jgi:hypothetical protein
VEPELVVDALTFLSAVVIVATRLRLSPGNVAGRHHVGRGTANLHFGLGLIGLVLWVAFLVTGHASSLVGILALFFYWLTALLGLLILLRWLPTRGRHASSSRVDRWSSGPGLSILAHLGMLVGVLVFTWFYATQS